MIKTLQEIDNKIREFNESTKYEETCVFCGRTILYTIDEIDDHKMKCPYCGHIQKIFKYNKIDIKIHQKISEHNFDSDSFKV